MAGKFVQLAIPVMVIFNVATGNKADRKSVSRDDNYVNGLHELDMQDLCSLLIELVDYPDANNILKAEATSSNNK